MGNISLSSFIRSFSVLWSLYFSHRSNQAKTRPVQAPLPNFTWRSSSSDLNVLACSPMANSALRNLAYSATFSFLIGIFGSSHGGRKRGRGDRRADQV